MQPSRLHQIANGAVICIFIILFFSVLTIGKAFFLPIILSVLLSLTFSPLVRSARKNGVPETVSAMLVVIIGTLLFVFSASFLAEPFSKWISQFPQLFSQIKFKIGYLAESLSSLKNATESISDVTKAASEQDVQKVEIADQGIVVYAASNLVSILTTVLVTVVLTFFLLAKGRVFYQKVVQSFTTLTDKKDALSTVFDIERGISRYLLAITVINALLGTSIALILWALGMPNPLLWGVAAAFLNFLPYVGALMGIIGSALVAILTFPTLGEALLVPMAYGALTILEGQFITPSIVGRQMSINPVIVFISIALWSWMWGLAGALIAVPTLVVIRSITKNVPGLSWLDFFISDYDEDNEEVKDKATKTSSSAGA